MRKQSTTAILGVIALAVLLLEGAAAGEQNPPQVVGFQRTAVLRESGYENVKTLREAVDVLRSQLTEDGKSEYAALVTEQRIRDTIRTAVESNDSVLEDHDKRNPGVAEYWRTHIRPVYLNLAETGEWPAHCAFTRFYGLCDARGVGYEGIGLRLELKTPAVVGGLGFALPVVDVWFGMVR